MVVPSVPLEIHSKTLSGCLKPEMVPNPKYIVFVLYVHTVIKFNLQIMLSRRLMTITNNKIENYNNICNKSYMNVTSIFLSKYLTHPSCCDDVRC